ncbi:hypothetical protein TIFTF001_027086 [Ficus carica]|uniref:Uncharacterized protein n=1 Tax=Ficus carica TaxID=3494 RepID=A0AA88DMB0_FICCA|nr:hypothetical protein TIFTF001_027086 [Ficus carica]
MRWLPSSGPLGGEEGGGGRREMQAIVCNNRDSCPSLCRDFISATVVILVPTFVANWPLSRIHPDHRRNLVPASEYLQWSRRNVSGTVSDQLGSPVMTRNADEGTRSCVRSRPRSEWGGGAEPSPGAGGGGANPVARPASSRLDVGDGFVGAVGREKER